SRIHVTHDGTGAFSDEHDHILFSELRSKKPSIAVCRIGMRCHEALVIEAIVCLQQQRSQSTERREIRIVREPNDNLGHECICSRSWLSLLWYTLHSDVAPDRPRTQFSFLGIGLFAPTS